MRVGGQPLFRVSDADEVQQFQHPGAGGIGRHTLVQVEHLADLLFDRVQRIERRHRLLEYHRNPVAPDLAEGLLVRTDQFLALERDRTGRMRRQGVGQ